MDYAFAALNNMNMPLLKNRTGQYVSPANAAFQASAKYAKWAKPDFYEILTNEPGSTSWPIVGATFILMRKTQDHPVAGKTVLKFFDWAYSHDGDNIADRLGYVPLPGQLQQRIRQEWAAKIKDSKGNPLKLN
jgi:phosphate transport system substrate-binding protein